MIKMIVLDLDGTLLNKKRIVSVKSQEYLKKLKEQGYIITIATGRIYESAKMALQNLDYVNYVITDTGASCYDVSNEKPLFTNTISLEAAKKMISYYDEDCICMDFCNKDSIYKYSDIIEDYYFIYTIKNWDFILENCHEISHITLIFNNNDKVTELYNKMKDKIPELNIKIMQDSYSSNQYIEAIKAGNDKYRAVDYLAKSLNIANDEIIAFGDGLNDIEMIHNCGIGVALNNALLPVKESAKYITKYDHDNDGVIEFLKEYLPN